MTRLRAAAAVTVGVVIFTAVQLPPASASPDANPSRLQTGGMAVVIDVHSGEMLSVTSAKPLPSAVIERFERLPGAKYYTQDVHTGGVVAISRK